MVELSSVSRFIVEYCDDAHPLPHSGELAQHEITISAIKSISAALIEVHDFVETVRSRPLGLVKSILLFDDNGHRCEEWPVPPCKPSSDEDIWRFMVVWSNGQEGAENQSAYFASSKAMGFPSPAQSRQDAVSFSLWIERQGGKVDALWGHDGAQWTRLGRDGWLVSRYKQLAHIE